MPTQDVYTVEFNRPIAPDLFAMRLGGPTGAFTRPGQFVNIALRGLYLRRPFSVCRWDPAGFEIIYKVVGEGTAQMALYGPGTQLDLLAGLGNGFDLAPAAGRKVALVGGGVGVPPLIGLAAALVQTGPPPLVALGFRTGADIFSAEDFEALGCPVYIATEDGAAGAKGTVVDLLHRLDYDYAFACGPNAMLRAVWALGEQKGAGGQFSFEERMGCGFGTCMGCSCHTKTGPKRVCADGPVFHAQEVVFE